MDTNSQVLVALRSDRASLIAQIAEIDHRKAELDQNKHAKQEELAAVENVLAFKDPDFAAARAASLAQGRRDRRTGALPDAARGVLLELGQPVYYQDLYEAMRERGIMVPGKNPVANLVSQMGRDDRFVRVGRGTYGLLEWQGVGQDAEATGLSD